MDITPLLKPEQKIIQSYGAGFFRVNTEILKCAILICGNEVAEWKCGDDIFNLSPDILSLKNSIEILLIGTGKNSTIIPPSKRKNLIGLGFTVDMMDTASACRTYNVLATEGRRVAAALMQL
jgi:uncharacterized protein